MARPAKQTVDYFPHRCTSGKTMFILETRFGDKGYSFWFKLLELLGNTEGHAYHYKNGQNRQYLNAYTRTEEDQAKEILNLLSDLEAIDKDLWQNDQIIWSDNFIKGISDAYRNRTVPIPTKPVTDVRNPPIPGIPDVRNPQSKLKESKLKESRVEGTLKQKLGEFLNVFVTTGEYGKLITKFGEVDTKERIERLATYKKSKGVNYKDDYATILNWARRDGLDAKPKGEKRPAPQSLLE